MKKVLSLFAIFVLTAAVVPVSATSPVEGAGLKFFHDYNPADKSYSGTSFSYSATPLSAEILLDTTNGVCFFGRTDKALDLVGRMIVVYNEKADYPLSLDYFGITKEDQPKKTELNFAVVQKTRAEKVTISWPRIRRCVR